MLVSVLLVIVQTALLSADGKYHQTPKPVLGHTQDDTDRNNKIIDADSNHQQQQQQHATSGIWKNSDKSTSAADGRDAVTDRDRTDVCARHRCRPGRVCRPAGDVPECVCASEDYCLPPEHPFRPVCGSDGQWYSNHCELHRSACVAGIHLRVDHRPTGCQLNVDEIEVSTVSSRQQQQSSSADASAAGGDAEMLSDSAAAAGAVPAPPSVSSPELGIISICSSDDYEAMKSGLVEYHCQRLGYSDCANCSRSLQQAAAAVFRQYDTNKDDHLDSSELTAAENVDRAAAVEFLRDSACHLNDFIIFEDRDADHVLVFSEFGQAIGMPAVNLDDDSVVFHTTVISGVSLQLMCNVRGADEIVWTRHTRILNDMPDSEFKTFDDGSLYIQEVSLQHVGNYSCHDRRWTDVSQTHVVDVYVTPSVRVNPSTQVHRLGTTATLQCHVVGRPQPSIDWQFNEAPLQTDDWWHTDLEDDNQTLRIRQLRFPSDTGAYKCRGSNVAGTSQDIATVFVEKSDIPPQQANGVDLYQVYVVFHDAGYTLYEPQRCHVHRSVIADMEVLPTASRHVATPHVAAAAPRMTLCNSAPGGATTCSWGRVVNVRNKLLYATQPELNRIVVINIRDRHNPVEVIRTDKHPVEVEYVELTDQVWVLCGYKNKIPNVIRQASEDLTHSVIHVQPLLYDYDPITALFLPPPNDLMQSLRYGYASQSDGHQLLKLDLSNAKFIKSISLVDQKCSPENAAFLLIGGKVIINCARGPMQSNATCVIIDYVTDAILPCPTELAGGPYRVSPDYKYLVVVKNDVMVITVFRLTGDGWPELFYDKYIECPVSDVTFFPSTELRSYDLFATATYHDAIFHLELETGKLDEVQGSEWLTAATVHSRDPHREPPASRFLVTSGVFGDHLITRGISGDSMTIIDGRENRVHCTWQNVSRPDVSAWIEPLRL